MIENEKFIENKFKTKEDYYDFLKNSKTFFEYENRIPFLWVEKRNKENLLEKTDFEKLPVAGETIKNLSNIINSISFKEDNYNDLNFKLVNNMNIIIDLFLFSTSLLEMESIVKTDFYQELYKSFEVVKKPKQPKLLNKTLDLNIALDLVFKSEDYEKASWYLKTSFLNNNIIFHRNNFLKEISLILKEENFSNSEISTIIKEISTYLEKNNSLLEENTSNSLSFVLKNRIRDKEYFLFIDDSFKLINLMENFLKNSF